MVSSLRHEMLTFGAYLVIQSTSNGTVCATLSVQEVHEIFLCASLVIDLYGCRLVVRGEYVKVHTRGVLSDPFE